MKTITIVEDDRIGLVSDISYILGKEKINIENISFNSVGGKGIISIQVHDERKAINTLNKNGFKVLETDLDILKLEDKPGKLAEITKLLADNKIAIINLHIISKGEGYVAIGITTDKPKKTKKVLNSYEIKSE